MPTPEAIRTQILTLVREYHAAKFAPEAVLSADYGLSPVQNAKNKDLTPEYAKEEILTIII